MKGNITAVRAFIDDGVDLDEKDEHGSAPLHIAIQQSKPYQLLLNLCC